MNTTPKDIRRTLDYAIINGYVWTWDDIFEVQSDVLQHVFMTEYRNLLTDRLRILAARTLAKYGKPVIE